MTDVWTSAGVIAGVAIVGLTGWIRLDPIIALLVAANILWTGLKLLRRSALGLLDPLVSLSTALADKAWVFSLTWAAAILLIGLLFPRGFCGYLCPLGTLIDLFDMSVPSGPAISRRKMFGYPAAFANGNLFIGLHQDDFIMRLSEKDRARFTAEFGERTFEPMKGRPMREYVRLPKELLGDARKRASWIKRSLRYAETIAPKAKTSTKKPTAKPARGSRV